MLEWNWYEDSLAISTDISCNSIKKVVIFLQSGQFQSKKSVPKPDINNLAHIPILTLKRTIGLQDVKALTFSTQSAHRWWWWCQPHMPADLYPQKDSWYSFLLEAESTQGQCIPQIMMVIHFMKIHIYEIIFPLLYM
jgi:hypothetical protein